MMIVYANLRCNCLWRMTIAGAGIHLCILLCHIVCLVVFHTLLSGLICTTSVHSVSNAVVDKRYSVVLMIIANHVCKGRV